MGMKKNWIILGVPGPVALIAACCLLSTAAVAGPLSAKSNDDDIQVKSAIGSLAKCSPETSIVIYSPHAPRAVYKFPCTEVGMYDFDNGRTLWLFNDARGAEIGFSGSPKKSESAAEILVVERYHEKPVNKDITTTPAAGVCGLNRKVHELSCHVVFHDNDSDYYGAATAVAGYNKFEQLNANAKNSRWHD